MSRQVFLNRVRSVLVPVGEADEAAIRELPADVDLSATIVRPRSGRQLRFYWALCHKVAILLQAMGREEASREYVSDCFKVATGHMELVPLPPRLQQATGQHYAVLTRSISFDKMEQADFNRFVDRIIAYTLTELLPHVPTRALKADIDKMLKEQELR